MPRQSVIQFRPHTATVVLREDFLAICDGSQCAAMVLAQFQHWFQVKLEHRAQARAHNHAARNQGETATQDEELWVYKKQSELKEELMNLFGETAIGNAVALLLAKGYLQSRANPTYNWDRTKQYLFEYRTVQEAIDTLPEPEIEAVDLSTASREFTASRAQNQGFNRANPPVQSRTDTEAIPEITFRDNTTETTPKRERSARGAQSARETARIQAGFERFWSVYPNRVSKSAALKAWEKIKPSEEQIQQILCAIQAQTENREAVLSANGFYPEWKNPATWLNQSCWTDEMRPMPVRANITTPTIRARTVAPDTLDDSVQRNLDALRRMRGYGQTPALNASSAANRH